MDGEQEGVGFLERLKIRVGAVSTRGRNKTAAAAVARPVKIKSRRTERKASKIGGARGGPPSLPIRGEGWPQDSRSCSYQLELLSLGTSCCHATEVKNAGESCTTASCELSRARTHFLCLLARCAVTIFAHFTTTATLFTLPGSHRLLCIFHRSFSLVLLIFRVLQKSYRDPPSASRTNIESRNP